MIYKISNSTIKVLSYLFGVDQRTELHKKKRQVVPALFLFGCYAVTTCIGI